VTTGIVKKSSLAVSAGDFITPVLILFGELELQRLLPNCVFHVKLNDCSPDGGFYE
jgi:hypothetical protein